MPAKVLYRSLSTEDEDAMIKRKAKACGGSMPAKVLYRSLSTEDEDATIKRKAKSREAANEDWDSLLNRAEFSQLRTRLAPLLPIIVDVQVLYRDLVHQMPDSHPVMLQLGILQWRFFVPLQQILQKPGRITEHDLRLLRKMADVLPEFLNQFQNAAAKAKLSSTTQKDYAMRLMKDYLGKN